MADIASRTQASPLRWAVGIALALALVAVAYWRIFDTPVLGTAHDGWGKRECYESDCHTEGEVFGAHKSLESTDTPTCVCCHGPNGASW